MDTLTQDRKLELWKEVYLKALETPRYHDPIQGNLVSGGAFNSEHGRDRHYFCKEVADLFVGEVQVKYLQSEEEERNRTVPAVDNK